MEVIWTHEALERLDDIHHYLAVQEHAPQAARDLLNRILARESQIQQMPLSGRTVPDYSSLNLRELLEGSYRIIYLIQADRILIISVMHQSRLLPRVKEIKAAAAMAVGAIENGQDED